MVLKALAQRIVLKPSRSIKVANPPLLINEANPIFNNLLLDAKVGVSLALSSSRSYLILVLAAASSA